MNRLMVKIFESNQTESDQKRRKADVVLQDTCINRIMTRVYHVWAKNNVVVYRADDVAMTEKHVEK